MSKINLAISFGSSETIISIKKQGIVLREPTMMLKTDGNVFYGIDAKSQTGRASVESVFSAPVKEGKIADEYVATEILKTFISKITEKRAFFKPQIFATFLVPCSLSADQKVSFKNVAYGAGICIVKFLPVVIASKKGYLQDSTKKDGAVICDIGGEKTDIAIVSENKIIAGLTLGIGGANIDFALMDYIEKIYDLKISIQMAEKIKIEVGSLYANDKSDMEVGGISAIEKVPKTEIISASDVCNVAKEFYEEIAMQVANLLKGCSSDISSDIITNGIFLSGGASLMPGLKTVFENKLSLPVFVNSSADIISVIGANKII